MGKKKAKAKKEEPPAEKFANEIVAVCTRWWEESDLDEETMYAYGEAALKAFTDAQVSFEADFELDEDEEGTEE